MRTGVFVRWLAHPLTVGATAVLLLNDHVVKHVWPGLVTGKLSDVAGLVVAPPVLGLLLGLFGAGRAGAAAAVLLTGAGFAVVKLVPAAAGVASAAWSVVNGPSVVLADPGDLFALPALGLAWWAWRRAAAPPQPPGRAVRWRIVIAGPFAVLAITATSAPAETLPSVDSVRTGGETGTQIVVEADGALYGSSSGVDGWTLLPDAPPAERRRQVEACVPQVAAHCYRVHGGGEAGFGEADFGETLPRGGRLLGVDETTDAGRTWRTAWEVPAGRWPFVLRQHPFPGGLDRPEKVASVDVVVRAVPGGHEVIVANGVDGLAVRGADGTWRRVPFVAGDSGPTIRPVPLTGFGRAIGDYVNDAGLITLLALLIGMSVAAGRARARGARVRAAVLPLSLLVVSALPLTGLVAFFTSNAGVPTGLWLVFSLWLAGIGAGLALAQRVLRRSRVAVLVAAAVLTGLAFAGPLLGWTVGHPQESGSAVGLGLLLAAGGLSVVVAAGGWAGRDPVHRPVPVEPPWPPWPAA
ncbi:hypothetical protein Q5425_05210 [Amycolatopsis sp. A133]|uniref:hypothetical protein n=1 Tax=Amycolatopsis sp. A133 TaxID=3064472 RepID=UPI0027F05E50|nr:hypothetical protein [Amycolatopsis sp. A133]MDQ7803116.1 hypothetical protein [Amycolatopsis sp. A133]